MNRILQMKKSTRSSLFTYGLVIGAYLIIQLLRSFREGGVGSVLEGQLVPICAYVTMALALNLVVGVWFSRTVLLSIIREGRFHDLKWYKVKKNQKIYPIMKRKYIWFAISICMLLAGVLGFMKNGVSLDTQFTGGTTLKYEIEGAADVNSDAVAAKVSGETGRNVNVRLTGSP